MQNMHNFLAQTPFSGHEQTNNTLPNDDKNEKKVSIAFSCGKNVLGRMSR